MDEAVRGYIEAAQRRGVMMEARAILREQRAQERQGRRAAKRPPQPWDRKSRDKDDR